MLVLAVFIVDVIVNPVTVLDVLMACGVDNVALFLGETQAQRIAYEVFDGSFASCMGVTFKEFDEHFKTYSDLTVAYRQIRIRSGTRKNIKAFVQWIRDEIRLGLDPSRTPFPSTKLVTSFDATKRTRSFRRI